MSTVRIEPMITINLTDEVSLSFGTLFLRRKITAMLPLHPELVALAHQLRKEQPGIDRSNVGGWHSDGNIFARRQTALIELSKHLQAALQQISVVANQVLDVRVNFQATIFGWMNIHTTGGYHQPHYHPGTTWSGVYYIQTGETVPNFPLSGCIQFVDPRSRCETGPDMAVSHLGIMSVQPEDGLLLLFPSYLEHYVHPYFGRGERISLAFNCTVKALDPIS